MFQFVYDKRNLNLNHFKVFFASTTLRAGPIHRDLRPGCSGGNPMIRRTCGFIIYPAAYEAHPGFCLSHSVGNLHQSPRFQTRLEAGGARHRIGNSLPFILLDCIDSATAFRANDASPD
jgi:hypothetical protein